jgi:hypothetical protein
VLDSATSSTGRAVLLRHLLVPRRDFATTTFTSLLPYRVGGRNRYVAAVPDRISPGVGADPSSLPAAVTARRFVWSVMLAELTGPWRPVATLEVGRHSGEDPRFDVVAHGVPGFAPAGWLNRLRGPAYRGSQLGSA